MRYGRTSPLVGKLSALSASWTKVASNIAELFTFSPFRVIAPDKSWIRDNRALVFSPHDVSAFVHRNPVTFTRITAGYCVSPTHRDMHTAFKYVLYLFQACHKFTPNLYGESDLDLMSFVKLEQICLLPRST